MGIAAAEVKGESQEEKTRMTIEEKKRYLEQYAEIDAKVKRLQMEIDAERAAANEASRLMLNGMPRSIDTDSRLERHIIRASELIEEYAVEIEALQSIRMEIRKYLQKMDNETERSALYYHYICGLTWEAVAEQMCFSNSGWLYEIRRRALNNIEIQENEKQSSKK